MNVKRAIWMGLLVYVLSFLIGLTAMLALGIDMQTANEMPAMVWYIGIAGTVVLVTLFSVWYFRNAEPGWKEGLKLGIVFVLIGAVIDLLIMALTVSLAAAGPDPLLYYSNPLFWLTLVIVIATAMIVGAVRRPKPLPALEPVQMPVETPQPEPAESITETVESLRSELTSHEQPVEQPVAEPVAQPRKPVKKRTVRKKVKKVKKKAKKRK